jgi:cell division protein FtsB
MSSRRKIKISDVHGNNTYVDVDELAELYEKQKKVVEELEKRIQEAEIELRKENHE